MDTLFYVDNYLCTKLRRLGFNNHRLSYSSAVVRFVDRFTKKFITKGYEPISNEVKKIWIFWAQGRKSMPPIVKSCYDSVIINKGEYEVVLLDMNNLKEFVNIPEYIYKKVKDGSITLTHFSDILRFALLSKYGGIWLDSTIFVTKAISNYKKVFSIKNPEDKKYISKCRWTGFLWYFPKGHLIPALIYDMLLEYWKRFNKLIDYFLIDYLINALFCKCRTFKEEIDNIEFSNNDLYFVQNHGNEPFDSKIWNGIIKYNTFLKNSWRAEIRLSSNGIPTYYKYIMSK